MTAPNIQIVQTHLENIIAPASPNIWIFLKMQINQEEFVLVRTTSDGREVGENKHPGMNAIS